MSETTFNMDDGYFEGLVRGFKGGLLTRADYANLCQCETLEGAQFFNFLCLSLSVSVCLCLSVCE